MLSEPNHNTCLNYTGLISQYIRSFSPDESQEALQYLYLLTLYPYKEMFTVCQEKVVQQIVHCNDFKAILGEKEAYLNTRVGSIDKYKPLLGFHCYDTGNNKYKELIVAPVANIFRNLGRYKDAVYVFELCNGYKEVFKALNQEIHRIITRYDYADHKNTLIEPMQSLADFCVNTLAKYNRYYSDPQDEDIVRLHKILLNFLRATLENHIGNLDKAIEYIRNTDVFPVHSDLNTIMRHVTEFQNQDDYVRNLLPYIILIALEEKSNCKPISAFLTMGKLQMPESLQNRVDQ